MQLALEEARTALKAGEFPVGCVLVRDGEVVAAGARQNSGIGGNEFDHAENVALRHLLKAHPELDFSEVIVYSTLEPCLMCFTTLILNGFRTIVYGYEDVMGGGSRCDRTGLPMLYRDAKLSIRPGVLRQQSLILFKRFFSSADNAYWADSLLSRYTLDQPFEVQP